LQLLVVFLQGVLTHKVSCGSTQRPFGDPFLSLEVWAHNLRAAGTSSR
jgi:hypothetical protein